MSDNRGQGFLQHILAEPDDDTPRLIYADWLEEQGDSARAEFIRVQVERASLPKWEGRQVWLSLRERALLEQHGEKWKAELPRLEGVKWGDFRRGFLATATFASFEVLRERAGACWAATPLEAVSVRWPRGSERCDTIAPIAGLRELSLGENVMDLGEVEMLAAAPLLSTLRGLTISDASLGAEAFQHLTASPHLRKLRALRLPSNSIGNGGVEPLVEAASLTSLEELDLSETDNYGQYGEDPVLESIGLEALAQWPGLARMRSLDLSGNAVGQRGLRALLRSPYAVGLKELILRNNGLPGEAMQEFEKAEHELRLEVLDLGENPLDDLGAAYLASARCLRELKVLEVDICEMSRSAAYSLAAAPFLAELRRLNASHNSFGSKGVQTLVEMEPRKLHTLLLANNSLGNEAIADLAASPASDTLLELDLSLNDLGDRAARALAKSDHLQSLLILRLNTTWIDKAGEDALRDSPLGKRLAVLEVSKRAEDDDEIPS